MKVRFIGILSLLSLSYITFNASYAFDNSRTESLSIECNRYNQSNSCLDLADELRNSGNTRSALSYYEKSCDLGNGIACFSIASLFDGGYDVARNDRLANKFYEKACNKSAYDACTRLADHYRRGIGTSKNLIKARNFFDKGCTQREARSCIYLGEYYEFGDGVPKDVNKAQNYYKRACDSDSRFCSHLRRTERKTGKRR